MSGTELGIGNVKCDCFCVNEVWTTLMKHSIPSMCCVSAADVRLVLHVNLPKTVEGFYQESGRGGRDGLPARSVLLYSLEDR